MFHRGRRDKGDDVHIGLIDVDGHNFPNLALMKISAWHKRFGDNVDWAVPIEKYDIVYQSKVFDDTYSADINWIPQAEKIIKGGTGYGLDNKLPDEIEHIYPDYSLYPRLTNDTAYGFLTRGCPRHCDFCIVGDKEGLKSVKVANLSEFWAGQKYIKLLDPNILACREHMELFRQLKESGACVDFTQGLDIRLINDENISEINLIRLKEIHFAWDNPSDDLTDKFRFYAAHAKRKPHGRYGTVYVLTNHGTTIDDDLRRIYTLRDLGYSPYVMVYNKPDAPRIIKRLQRWCNNRWIFGACHDFYEYGE